MATKKVHCSTQKINDNRLTALLNCLGNWFGRSSFTLPIGRVPEKIKNPINLKDKVVLVTGGSRGIGKAICEQFSAVGARVIGTSRFVQKEITQQNGYELISLDVRNDDSVNRCIEQVVNKYGRIDILVNNAGIGQYGRLIKATIDDWLALFQTNLFGVHRMTVAAYPHMHGAETRIITIGSLDGEIGYPYQAIYSISKRALQQWNDLFAFEQRKEHGPQFVLLEPAFVNTGFGKTPDIVNTEPDSSDIYVRLNELSFPWMLQNYGIAPSEVGEAVFNIASMKKPALRYFVGVKGSLFLGTSLEDILTMVYTKPPRDVQVFMRRFAKLMYIRFRMQL